MGDVRSPDQVLRICAITTRYREALDWALEKYQAAGLQIALQSETFAFDMTTYYNAEMGEDLRKTLVAFAPLADPSELADWKIQSNGWEQQYIDATDFEQARPLNLDPGYVTLAKLVLATTKDRDHRVYLRDGMLAEVTMSFSRGDWKSHPWTYPDYQIPISQEFLNAAREKLKELFRAAAT